MHPLASLFVLAADGVNVVEAYVVDNERGAREGGAPASEAVAIPEDEEKTPDAPFGQRLKEVCRLSLAIAVVLTGGGGGGDSCRFVVPVISTGHQV